MEFEETLAQEDPYVTKWTAAYHLLLSELFPPRNVPYPMLISACDMAPPPPDDPSAGFELLECFPKVDVNAVLALQVAEPSKLSSPRAREDAHMCAKRTIELLLPRCSIPTFRLVSVFGTRFVVYSARNDLGLLEISIEHPAEPADEWSWDVLEAAGAARLRALVPEIKDELWERFEAPPS